MSLGLGIVLFVIGAILAFALNLTRRRSVATSHTSVDPATGDRATRAEHSTPEDPTVL
jgi:hypothetical protein